MQSKVEIEYERVWHEKTTQTCSANQNIEIIFA